MYIIRELPASIMQATYSPIPISTIIPFRTPPLSHHPSSIPQHDRMKIREHEFVLERLPEHVLHEPLDPAHVLEDVPVCTADLGFERDRGEEAVGDGEGLGRALRVAMGVVVVMARTER
jgi:hypothetical protein